MIARADKTKTAMGSRKLRYFLEHPLISAKEIQNRLDFVEALNNDFAVLAEIRNILTDIYDIERVMVRITGNSNSPKDMVQLKTSFKNLDKLYKNLLSFNTQILGDIESLKSLEDIYILLDQALTEDPPIFCKINCTTE